MAIWDDVLDEQDRKMFAKAKMGGKGRFGDRPALLIVDMTYAFADSKYRLGHSETGYPAVDATSKLLQKAREKGIPVYFTRAYTGETKTGTGVWKSGEGKTEEENTIVEQIAPRAGEIVIQKRKPSAFFGTDLVNMLIHQRIDTLFVTGLTTSGCVRASVVDAYSYNYNVIVPEECVGDRSQISHKIALMDINMKYGDVLKLDQVLEWMDQHLNAKA
ncbi:MAG: hydrolase [Massilia sp.]|jgi:maleamate amidohydrolase|nr:hydrolase [Massilia sp.]